MERMRVGVLGATGLVGQRLLAALADHPWFDVVSVSASERSAGRPFADAVRWALAGPPPARVASMRLVDADDPGLTDCDLVFSGLPSGPAREIEPRLVDAGAVVVSNASALRMDARTPLLMPEVNPDHLRLVDRPTRAGGGFAVTNPNCSVTGLVLSLAPIERAFGLEAVQVTTLQAVSGAGLDGPSALSLLDNVLPHIPGEEEKLEREPQRILGTLEDGAVRPAGFDVSAQCNRVAVVDGHLMTVAVRTRTAASPAQAAECMRAFRVEDTVARLPSALAAPLRVLDAPDRPQPRLDRETDGGMGAVVGCVRACPVLGLKWTVLCHNTLRGAAGGALLNAELLAAAGLVVPRGEGS